MDPPVHRHGGTGAELQEAVVKDRVLGDRDQRQQHVLLRRARHHPAGRQSRIGDNPVNGRPRGGQAGILRRQWPRIVIREHGDIGLIGVSIAIREGEAVPVRILVRQMLV